MKRFISLLIFLGMAGFVFGGRSMAVSKVTSFGQAKAIRFDKPMKLNVVNPLNFIDQPLDTLLNDDGFPVLYFSPANWFWLSRLTPPGACTLQYVMGFKYAGFPVPTDTTIAGCSLMVWSDSLDTLGRHRPGHVLYGSYEVDSLPPDNNVGLFSYDVKSANLRFTSDFWVGWRCVILFGDDSLNACGDNGVSALDRNIGANNSTVQNAWGFVTQGDIMNRAIVKNENIIHDIAVLEVGNSQGFFMPNPGNARLSATIQNNGDTTEVGFNVVCTVYTEAGAVVAQYSTPIAGLAHGATCVITYFPNWAPNNDGVYYIAVHALLAGDDYPENDRQLREAQVCSSPAELRLDDGGRLHHDSLSNAYACPEPGYAFANKFTPPYYPAIISAAKYWCWFPGWPAPGGNRMIARIYDDDGPGGRPGTARFGSDTITSVIRGGWTEVPITPNLQIAAGSFYVAYVQTDLFPNCPALGIDENPPFYNGNNWTLSQDTWSYDSTDFYRGDWGIRAIVAKAVIAPSGWESKGPIPTTPSGKNPKSGSGMAGLNGKIYFLKASNTQDLAIYDPATDGWTTSPDTMPIGTKGVGDGKKPKKGASITAYDGKLFVLRGNNTPGFWRYVVSAGVGETLGWKKMANIPTGAKNPKDASGLVAVTKGGNPYIFAMKGSKTDEFYLYDIATNTWAPTPTKPGAGTSTKIGYKKGSCLCFDGANTVFVLKGGYGDFFKYDLNSETWTELRQYNYKTFLNRNGKKKKIGEGSGLVYYDGDIYLLKGGNTLEMWKYPLSSDADTWIQLDTFWDIPQGGGKKVKAGGGLTLLDGVFYAAKGANTDEFYRHDAPTALKPVIATKNTMANRVANDELKLTLAPNPAINRTAIYYTLPKAGPVSFTLYNVAGAMVRTDVNPKPTNNGVLMIDTKALPSGVYILRFSSDELTITRKLVLQK